MSQIKKPEAIHQFFSERSACDTQHIRIVKTRRYDESSLYILERQSGEDALLTPKWEEILRAAPGEDLGELSTALLLEIVHLVEKVKSLEAFEKTRLPSLPGPKDFPPAY